jgi:phosphomevalonate kinase
MTATAPGNILLMGEYAVLEEGGLGVALAVHPRARAEITPAGCCTDEPELLQCCRSACRSAGSLPDGVLRDLDHLLVTLDTGQFNNPDTGEKLGLGSSAAGAVAICAGLLQAAGVITAGMIAADVPRGQDRDLVFTTALSAHRAFQGGKGSGYDVGISTYGGARLFHGGAHPGVGPRITWTAGPFTLLHAGTPVRTRSAVEAYRSWRYTHPAAARRFLSRSNSLVRDFVAARTRVEALDILRAAAALGLEIGEVINVPADPGTPGKGTAVIKATGAGAELAVSFPVDPDQRDDAGPGILPCEEGVEWLRI